MTPNVPMLVHDCFFSVFFLIVVNDVGRDDVGDAIILSYMVLYN